MLMLQVSILCVYQLYMVVIYIVNDSFELTALWVVFLYIEAQNVCILLLFFCTKNNFILYIYSADTFSFPSNLVFIVLLLKIK